MALTLLTFLVMAVVTDFKEMRISNRLIASGLFWGLALRVMAEGYAGIAYFLMNISIPVILLFLFFQLRALGAGDIKLFSVAGAFLTTEQLAELMVTSFLVACAVGIVKMIRQKGIKGIFGKQKTLLHFSASILTAYFIVIWRWTIG